MGNSSEKPAAWLAPRIHQHQPLRAFSATASIPSQLSSALNTPFFACSRPSLSMGEGCCWLG